jgi:hypothetical protein
MAFPQQWIPVDGAEQGAPVTFEVLQSDASSYKVGVRVNGLLDEIVTHGNREFHRLSLGWGGSLQQAGEPALPVISRLIAISGDATVSASVTEGKWTDLEIGTVLPQQQSWPGTDISGDFAISDNAYSQPFIPAVVRLGEEQTFQDIRNVGVYVCPFRYYPAEGKLSVLSEFILEVDFTPKNSVSSVNVLTPQGNQGKYAIFDNTVYFNAEQQDAAQTRSTNYDYLIIVNNNSTILNSQELVNFRIWKALKGYRTKVVAMSSIGSYDYEIKQYITGQYSNGVRYVLLVGDDNSIPVGSRSSFYFPAQTVKGDYWYGCVDGNSDWQADIAIGRFSVSSAWEFRNMVNKTIRYEFTPPLKDSVLLVAHRLVPDDYYGYQRCCENIRNHLYYNPVYFTTAYGADSSNGGDNATNADVIAKINQGIALVNYRGYGYPGYWGGEDGGSATYGWNTSNELLTYAEASNFGSNSNTVIFSVAPRTGDISVANNMLEAFTRPVNGAAAYIGSTAGQYQYPCNHFFDMTLFETIIDDGIYNIGDANIDAHVTTINSSASGMLKDNAFSYMCGGDPTLELWSVSPQSFGDVELTEANGNITITTGYYGSYKISICDDAGELLNVYNVYNNTYTFAKPTGNFYVGITQHNYIPHVIYYNVDAEAIQNVTFAYDAYYHHTPLEIGYGVTPSIEDGDVTVKDGSKLIIKNGTGGVYIDAGFKCEKGARLEIK